MGKTKLTPKQERFCEEYLVDLNATQAYKRAGYSVKSDNAAAVESQKLLRNPKIHEQLSDLRKAQSERTEITADRVLAELAAIAFADRTKISNIRENGEIAFTPTDNLSADVKKTISGIECGKYGIKVSTCDKVKALELLCKHLGIFETTKTDSDNNNVQIVIAPRGENNED